MFLTGSEAVLALRARKIGVENPPRSFELSAFSRPLYDHQKSFAARDSASVLRLTLVGATLDAKVTGLDELPGKSNYFIGNDPKKWRTNVPNYARVKYQNVYPGIDLVYYGNQGKLEYDWVVAPDANPNRIAFEIQGARGPVSSAAGGSATGAFPLRTDRAGDLVIRTEAGEVCLRKPVVYQSKKSGHPNGNSQFTIQNSELLDGHYVLLAENRVGFEVENYDKSKPLVIDPVLDYSTYLGGSQGNGIAVDSSGNAYVTGTTGSGFPTVNPVQTTGVIFVAKLNAADTALIYSTYLGGSGIDSPAGIALDSSGDAYVTGHACSTDFPTTAGAFQSASQGPVCNQGFGGDTFVVKLNAAGNALAYSTYLGGSAWDQGNGIAVDSSGNAYVTGLTESSNFPTMNPFQSGCSGGPGVPCGQAFVTKLNTTGTALVYSTYLGGSGGGQGNSIAVDSSDSAYVTGSTGSGFPIVNSSAFDPGACGGGAFVTKFTPLGSALAYSTYLGCASGSGIAVDSLANAYITGSTSSTSFPTKNAIQPAKGGGNFDAFVTELDAAGTALVYSTYLGGSSFDEAFGIAVDSSGNAYVSGSTSSTDFPSTNSIQGGCGSTYGPAFVTEVGAAGSALVYSTCLGGSNNENGIGIAVDALGNAYVTGLSGSNNFPTVNAFQPTCGGSCGADAFVAKISPVAAAAVSTWPVALNFPSQLVNTQSFTQLTLRNMGSAALTISNLAISGADSGDFTVMTNGCGSTVGGGGSCNLQIGFTPAASGSRTATLTITDNGINSPQTVPLGGTGTPPPDFAVAVASGTSSSATVTAGGTATYTIAVSPLGGFNQAITISCSGAPTAATCTPSPGSVTLDAANSQSVAVTITTTARGVVLPPTTRPPNSPSSPIELLPLACVAALMIAFLFTNTRRLGPQAAFALLVLCVISLPGLAACGGGGSSGPPPPTGTPAGTYTLTVTGTSGNLSHKTTVTLTVN